MTRPLSRIRSTTSARPVGCGARWIPAPPGPLVASDVVAIVYFLPARLLPPLDEDFDLDLDEPRLDDELFEPPEPEDLPRALEPLLFVELALLRLVLLLRLLDEEPLFGFEPD